MPEESGVASQPVRRNGPKERTGGAGDRGKTNISEMARRGHDVEGARLKVVISSASEFTASDPTAGCAESLGVGAEMVRASRSVTARKIPEW